MIEFISAMYKTMAGEPSVIKIPNKIKVDDISDALKMCKVNAKSRWYDEISQIYLYSNKVRIIREQHNTNSNVPFDDIFSFDEFESIVIDNLHGTYVIRLNCKKGTRYSMLNASRDYPGQYFPNEIVFNSNQLDIVSEFINETKNALSKYNDSKIPQFNNFFNFGNVNIINASIDNSQKVIYEKIEELGGEDKEELKDILNEIVKLLEKMADEKTIPNNVNIFKRVLNHMDKHGWFYSDILSLGISVFLKIIFGIVP